MDVVGVGNAIVDVIANVDEGFITEHALEKGAMTLIDTERAVELYDVLPNPTEVGGGSAANTIVGIASFGGTAAYVGKVSQDSLGETFRDDLRAAGVAFDMPLATTGQPTARSMIVVTPDAERTMNTFLGVSADLQEADIDLELVASPEVLYCEGYLYDAPPAKAAIRLAMASANAAGKKVSLTLSDGFCVDRHRDDFRALIADSVDIVFGNEDEILSLYQTTDFEVAAAAAAADCDLVCLTRSAAGSLILAGDERIEIAAYPVENLVDTTGAGDLYAAGVLFGIATGRDLETSGKLGSLAASEIISHVGPRPHVSLAELAREHQLL